MKIIKIKGKKCIEMLNDFKEKIHSNNLTIQEIGVLNLRHKSNMWELIHDKYDGLKKKDISLNINKDEDIYEIVVFEDKYARWQHEEEEKLIIENARKEQKNNDEKKS